MKHPGQETVSAYIDGVLEPARRAEIDAHLKACEECARAVAELRQISTWMKESPALTPPESFYTQVMRKARMPEQRASQGWRLSWRGMAAACVAVLVMVITRDMWRGHVTKDTPPQMYSADLRDFNPQESSPGEFSTDKLAAGRREKEDDADGAPDMNRNIQTKEKGAGWEDAERKNELARRDAPAESVSSSKMAEPATPPAAAAPARQELQQAKTAPLAKGAAGWGYKPQDEKTSVAAGKILPPAETLKPDASPEDRGLEVEERTGTLSVKDAGKKRARAASIPEGMEWTGFSSAIKEPLALAIRNQREWEHFWARHTALQTPRPATPPVDFEKFMVVAVFAGERPTGGYFIRIESVEMGDITTVFYWEGMPLQSGFSTQALTQPYHIKVIPRKNAPLQFKKLP